MNDAELKRRSEQRRAYREFLDANIDHKKYPGRIARIAADVAWARERKK